MALGSYLRSRGLKDGVLGGRRSWLVIGLVMWAGRTLKKILSRPSELISSERLEPGQSITILAHAPSESTVQTRRVRRRQSRPDS